MSERVNKTYKPSELAAAIEAVQFAALMEGQEAADVVKSLHRNGWKLVQCEKAKP